MEGELFASGAFMDNKMGVQVAAINEFRLELISKHPEIFTSDNTFIDLSQDFIDNNTDVVPIHIKYSDDIPQILRDEFEAFIGVLLNRANK